MKIAFCNEVFGEMPLEKQFAIMADAGFDGAELAPFTLDDAWVSGAEKTADVRRIDAAERKKIVKIAQKAAVPVSGLHWLLAKTDGFYLTSPTPEIRRKTAAYLNELILFCAELGGEYLVLGSPVQRNILPHFSYDDGMKYAADVLAETLETLDRNHILMALEPLAPVETNFLANASQAVDLIEQMGKPKNLSVHLDCKAMAGGEKRPIPEVIRDPRNIPYEKTFHANDPNLRRPGDGDLDFGPVFDALKAVGFDGWIGVEPFIYEPDPETVARESARYLKRFL